MRQVRVTIRPNPRDPADDLQIAARLRRELWANSSVEIDPDNPFSRTQRDSQGAAYFDLVTEYPEFVADLIRQRGLGARVAYEVVRNDIGLICARCGFFSPASTRCENCGYRDIDRCPCCREEVPREQYVVVSGDLFTCPRCKSKVRLAINPNLVRPDDSLNEPAIIVESARRGQ